MLITHKSINLERPSLKSRSIVEQRKTEQLNITKHDSSILKQIKSQLNLDQDDPNPPKKKKKKSQPNPLSMKKKRNKLSRNSLEKPLIKKKRRRTRQIRMSNHLKIHLQQLTQHFSIKEFLRMK